jgi:cell wall-associated NlpC family hydrolase
MIAYKLSLEKSLKLYRFIKNNLGKKCGVSQKDNYNCGAFLSSLYKEVYKIDLPGGIAAQMNSSIIELYRDTSYLKEGDVLFFNLSDEQPKKISYNAFYLSNGFFLIASFSNGIIITEMKKPFWMKRFAAAGRIKQQFIGTTIKQN